MTDRELVQKVRSGSREALGGIIERYYADIFRFCLYMIGEENDAYDVTQDTFLKFIKYGSSYRHSNLKGYLLTIARNLCFNYFREQKEQNKLYEWKDVEKISVEQDKLHEAEISAYLKNLLGKLSQENREVVILRIYEQLKFKDIARLMGSSVSTAKSRFRLGMQHLRKMMTEDDYERS